MSKEDFQAAIEDAKRLEKKSMEYAPYQGEIVVERTLDLEPREYVDLNYHDMINLYERSQKIISTAGLGILAQKAEKEPDTAPKAETAEVASKLMEMTSETLKEAEEVAKEPGVQIEAPAPQPPPEPEKKEIEFETITAPEIEIEAPPPAPELEVENPLEVKVETPKAMEPEAAPELEVQKPAEAPIEKKVVVAVPPALRESPDRVASKRYEQMEEQIRAALGEKADEMTLKKKMLDLTKQLFKEKTTSKREEIKLQITVLKNMLSGSGAKPAGGKKAAGGEPETHVKLLEAMLSAQQGELAQTKDGIIDSYNKQVAQIKAKFYEDIASTDDAARRKQIFEAFVFSVESIVEGIPEVIRKYQDFTAKKHAAELEKVKGSLSPQEKATMNSVDERLSYVNEKYGEEFASVRGIVGRQIENLIDVAGSEIFKKEEKQPGAEEQALEVVKEINETDEGTLLYFLHSKDPDYYKRYERKQLSKAETIFKAKELMAKDKGLSDSMVRRYFSQKEG